MFSVVLAVLAVLLLLEGGVLVNLAMSMGMVKAVILMLGMPVMTVVMGVGSGDHKRKSSLVLFWVPTSLYTSS